MEPNIVSWEKGWASISDGITNFQRILEEEQFNSIELKSKECMNLYTTVYDMCRQSRLDRQLYHKYKEAVEEYLKTTVLPSIRSKDDEFVLRELAKRWTNHKLMVKWLSGCFAYLDQHFTRPQKLPAVSEVGLACFRDLVFDEFHAKAKDALFVLIKKERDGAEFDHTLLEGIPDLFGELASNEKYKDDFVPRMLNDSVSYYSLKAQEWIRESSWLEYLTKAEECLRKESERLANCLDSSIELKLEEIVQHELLAANATPLLKMEESGCRALLEGDEVDKLSRMYKLYRKLRKDLKTVAAIFKRHITNEGTVLVQQAKDDASSQAPTGAVQEKEKVPITKILDLVDKYTEYVNDCFGNDALFRKALQDAFDIFWNKTVDSCSSAERLATFCDKTLKKDDRKKLSDEAIEDTLVKVLKLLAYTSDKDIFRDFYWRRLTFRLLKGANTDRERTILTVLKSEYGHEYTQKMEQMLTDLTLAKETKARFKDYLANNQVACLDFNLSVKLLTTGSWPSFKSTGLSLPAEMAKGVEAFQKFYRNKNESKKLTWIYSLGFCKIIGNFDRKSIELSATTYQAVILLLFNSADRLSYLEIADQSKLPEDDLKRVLHSLSCLKYKIILKDPISNNISETDHFEFNNKFTDRMNRITVAVGGMVKFDHDERNKVVKLWTEIGDTQLMLLLCGS